MSELLFLQFLGSTVIITVILLGVLLIKRRFANHLAIKSHYQIGILTMVLLVMPFVPGKVFAGFDVWQYSISTDKEQQNIAHRPIQDTDETQIKDHGVAAQDFAIAVDYSYFKVANSILGIAWAMGALAWFMVYIKGQRHLSKIRRQAEFIEDETIVTEYLQQKQQLKLKQEIRLCQSASIQAPIAFGVLKPVIILPSQHIPDLSHEEVKLILLHEMNHYKQRDIVMNYVMGAMSILYWFNPLVHKVFAQLREDREMMCDQKVLEYIEYKQRIVYGKTLLRFVESMAGTRASMFTTSLGGTKSQIKKRIEQVVSYQQDTWATKFKTTVVTLLMVAVILSQASAISVVAYDRSSHTFGEDGVVYEDLSAYFNGMDGSFVLYDMKNQQYTIYNKEKSEERVAPNSTYKIYSALIALEEGLISPENSQVRWNGEINEFEEWNKDQTLETALKDSVNWYFQRLDQIIGKRTIQDYLDHMGYGNKNIQGTRESYWIESSLKISPIEQVQLLTKFYNNAFNFKQEHIDVVKDSLETTQGKESILFGKTGSGVINETVTNGAYVGYIEREDNVFVFSTYVEDEESATGKVAAQITQDILKNKKIY